MTIADKVEQHTLLSTFEKDKQYFLLCYWPRSAIVD